MFDTLRLARKNRGASKNTLVFVYYSGHGAMQGQTLAICQDGTCFNLEEQLRKIGKAEGTYVIAFLDCCRKQIITENKAEEKEAQGGEKVPMKGKDGYAEPQVTGENTVITFGAPPTYGVEAVAKNAKLYFKYLTDVADSN